MPPIDLGPPPTLVRQWIAPGPALPDHCPSYFTYRFFALGPNGNLFIPSFADSAIAEHAPDGEFLGWHRVIVDNEPLRPSGVRWEAGHFYVRCSGSEKENWADRMAILDANWNLVDTWRSVGRTPTPFVVDREGDIFTVGNSRGNGALIRYAPDGVLLLKKTPEGRQYLGGVQSPIAIDADDVLYVKNSCSGIERWTSEGEFAGLAVGETRAFDEDMAVDEMGAIYVVAGLYGGGHVVLKYSRQGVLLMDLEIPENAEFECTFGGRSSPVTAAILPTARGFFVAVGYRVLEFRFDEDSGTK